MVLPLPLPGPLVYRLPSVAPDQTIALPSTDLPSSAANTVIGRRVLVPLGNRRRIGVLTGAASPHSFKGVVKEILGVFKEEPILRSAELRLLHWASEYYLTPIGEVLRHLIPPRLLKFQKESQKKSKAGPVDSPVIDLASPIPPPSLTPGQRAAVQKIEPSLDAGKTFLLHGITGSGKTEVYIELAREVIRRGGQVLVLVPEIGLTPQLVDRFQQGIGRRPAAYHSGLTPAQRMEVWRRSRAGEVPLVIGTRSAIFLSFPTLRLIVVDEEHDPSLKQEERFCYNARDLALWRGREETLTVVLGSATPSLETLHRAREGKIVSLPLTERPGVATLPTIQIVDLRRRKKESKTILTPELVEALEQTLRRKEQSLLFLNRRGFAPFLLCPRCGFIPRCSGCEISLTYHRKEAKLLCHYCDAEIPFTAACGRCGGLLSPSGIGTERIEQELRQLFPHAQIGRLDRDAGRRGEWLKILKAFEKRDLDILVGTQMVTKGHDFPHLTLVGIVDADVALNLPDFRSAERAFQILTQVSGRAGRGDRPGEVMIQTYHPEHASITSAARYDGKIFYEKELGQRREAGYPPFTRLIEIRLTGPHRETVMKSSGEIARSLKRRLPPDLAKILGPAPCPIERIRNKSRWHLLVKTAGYTKLQPLLRRELERVAALRSIPSNIKLLVNVDPMDMM